MQENDPKIPECTPEYCVKPEVKTGENIPQEKEIDIINDAMQKLEESIAPRKKKD